MNLKVGHEREDPLRKQERWQWNAHCMRGQREQVCVCRGGQGDGGEKGGYESTKIMYENVLMKPITSYAN